MSEDAYRKTESGWLEVDYTQLTVGAPVGDAVILVCGKCGKPCVRKGHTRTAIHKQSGVRNTAGRLFVQQHVECKSALPKHEDGRGKEQLEFFK